MNRAVVCKRYPDVLPKNIPLNPLVHTSLRTCAIVLKSSLDKVSGGWNALDIITVIGFAFFLFNYMLRSDLSVELMTHQKAVTARMIPNHRKVLRILCFSQFYSKYK